MILTAWWSLAVLTTSTAVTLTQETDATPLESETKFVMPLEGAI